MKDLNDQYEKQEYLIKLYSDTRIFDLEFAWEIYWQMWRDHKDEYYGSYARRMHTRVVEEILREVVKLEYYLPEEIDNFAEEELEL